MALIMKKSEKRGTEKMKRCHNHWLCFRVAVGHNGVVIDSDVAVSWWFKHGASLLFSYRVHIFVFSNLDMVLCLEVYYSEFVHVRR